MKRREFITGVSALALGQLVSGCNSKGQISLNIRLLQDSIPVQLLNEFRKGLKQPVKLNFDPEGQLKDLYQLLGTWKEQAEEKKTENNWFSHLPFIGGQNQKIPNLVTLGDAWLEAAIRQKLIQPLAIENLKGWQELSPRWQEIVQRNSRGQLDKSGSIWGAPYRWGTTVIAYRRDKFEDLGWEPTDWSDLWRKELRDRISLLDQPREVIGLTLKKLGYSYNTEDLSQVSQLEKELLALHRQAKLYSSTHYLEPLVLGDTWLAVGWSTDILSLGGKNSHIKVVIPKSGTAIWADLWVQPAAFTQAANSDKATDSTSIAKAWIDFCWQKDAAISMSLLGDAPSPILTNIKPDSLPKEVRDNPWLLPDMSIMDKSDFLSPLSDTVLKEYQVLWEKIRRS